MPTINLTENFNNIFDALLKNHMNVSGIAKSMGYTSSNQLHSALKGESMLSTKAIISLIQNANINPTFLFFGSGDMFLTDETEIENLRKENSELLKKQNEALKTIMELNELIKTLEKRNADLIDLSSAAIKYHKEHNEEKAQADENK